MGKLCQLAGLQLIRQIFEIDNGNNNYFQIKDIFKSDESKTQILATILVDLDLLESKRLNEVFYYRCKTLQSKDQRKIKFKSDLFSLDAELIKFKKILQDQESILRQMKLLQSIRSSGEEDKLLELIDKWEQATRDVIKELQSHDKTSGRPSLRKFVKKLGLNWENLGFESEDESEVETDEEKLKSESEYTNNTNINNENKYNNKNSNNLKSNDDEKEDFKRIKYEYED